MKQIPNLFTLLNLLFGCLAIVFLLTDGMVLVPTAEGTVYFDLPASIGLASLFIALAAVVDFFDGMLARLFKADSAMGRELDSLADVVSFGVAPGMILFSFLRLSWSDQSFICSRHFWSPWLLPGAWPDSISVPPSLVIFKVCLPRRSDSPLRPFRWLIGWRMAPGFPPCCWSRGSCMPWPLYSARSWWFAGP
ncbi:MAG: CDP-diacylglycerol--serine O-phosphatidyltransferase [Bacteroidota bacterium]